MSRAVSLTVIAAAVAVAVALAVLLLRSSPQAGGHGNAAATGTADVRVGHGRLGPMLVDAHGHTLYLFLNDTKNHSHCTGRCALVWPPAVVAGRPRAGAGVRRALLAGIARGDARQLVYRGHPLYRMSADVKPGDMAGQGFLGTWFAVSPAGHKLGKTTGTGEGY